MASLLLRFSLHLSFANMTSNQTLQAALQVVLFLKNILEICEL